MVASELIAVFTCTISLITHDNDMNMVLSSFSYYGETIFPVYTSIEQYMAVIYPVTYLSLKQGKGLWIPLGVDWLPGMILSSSLCWPMCPPASRSNAL
uniref:Uncharacterized protein n=1 Tax=Knipowitschia caucasica TaxID=637954 RepID=A0AAV2KM63_KNICA